MRSASGRSVAAVVLAAGLLAAGTAAAHYPMLEAERAVVDPGTPVRIRYAIGHPFVNDRFDVRPPQAVLVYYPQRRRPRELTDAVTETGSDALRAYDVVFTPPKPGDYVLSWRCGIFSEPPQRQVDDYAKLILHARGGQVGWDRAIGDPLEIVPLTRPYGLPVGATFRGQVLENGLPMQDGVVEAETYAERIPEPLPELMEYRRAERTDPSGCFAVTFDEPGWWLLSVATDGGPGQQGGARAGTVVKRAVLWLFVGPWDESHARDLTPIAVTPAGEGDGEGDEGEGGQNAPLAPPDRGDPWLWVAEVLLAAALYALLARPLWARARGPVTGPA